MIVQSVLGGESARDPAQAQGQANAWRREEVLNSLSTRGAVFSTLDPFVLLLVQEAAHSYGQCTAFNAQATGQIRAHSKQSTLDTS